MSLHRYDNAGFYPASEEADYTYCGKGKGEGYNVNIAWNYVRKYALTVCSLDDCFVCSFRKRWVMLNIWLPSIKLLCLWHMNTILNWFLFLVVLTLVKEILWYACDLLLLSYLFKFNRVVTKLHQMVTRT